MIILASLIWLGEPVKFYTSIVALGPVMVDEDFIPEHCNILGCVALYAMLLFVYSVLVVNESCDNA